MAWPQKMGSEEKWGLTPSTKRDGVFFSIILLREKGQTPFSPQTPFFHPDTIGKPIGILLLSWMAVRLGVAALPTGVRWSHVGVVGMVSGIGFTMALFIAQLAFPPGTLLETAKLAVLCASSVAGILALFAGYRILQPGHGASMGRIDSEAEGSIEK